MAQGSLTSNYNYRQILARITDGSRFSEFKENYGQTLVTGFSHIQGMPVGILANNGNSKLLLYALFLKYLIFMLYLNYCCGTLSP